MKTYYRFENGREMLDKIQSNTDLYCEKFELYVFQYSECGKICVYRHITKGKADKLRKQSKENGEYWGAFLGVGGEVYNDISSEDYKGEEETNIEFCNLFYNEFWEDVTN